MRFLVLSVLITLSLFADSISSFTADKDTAKPGDVVNLDISYIATKKYELHFTAYKNDDGTELSPNFSATDLRNIAYTIPNDANYDIKIVAELVEDGNSVDSKEVIVKAKKGCDVYLYVTSHGLYHIDPECSCSFYEWRYGGGHQHYNLYKGCNAEVTSTWHSCCSESAKTLLCHCTE